MNFASRIAEAAARFPGHVAVERVGAAGVHATTYPELMAEAERWSGWLAARGLTRGDRVAILADNDATWIAAYLGMLRVGIVAVPMDTAYRPAQVRTILTHSAARLLVAGTKYVAVGEEATGLRPGSDQGQTPVEIEPLTRRADAGGAPAPPIVDVEPAEAAVMLYTSGTTSDPKGVVLTHANLEGERIAAHSVVDCRETDAILGVLPLFHALAQMANLLVPLSTGARVVFLETVSSSSLVAALQERGITIFVCVPQFFYLIHQRVMTEITRAASIRRLLFRTLLATNGWCRDRLHVNPGRRWFARIHRALGTRMRILVTGGSRFDPSIGRDLYEMGFTLLNGYGLTETSGAATAQRAGDRFTTSVGPPLAGVEVRISREDGAISGEAPADGSGEILIRGPIVMREYFNRPDATAEALRDGWLHTGDLGSLDAEGRLFITGRKKEIIVLSSGKNLYPEEIEAYYQKCPFIKEVCVLGLSRPDEPASERLHAVIVPDEDALRARGAVNVKELLRFELEGISVNLPPHKRILSYEVSFTPLARTTTGKLRRHEIERQVREHGESADIAGSAPPSAADEEWLARPGHAPAVQAIADMLKRESVRPGANLELDLGLDSLERVEVLTMLEQHARVAIPTEVRAKLLTVRDLVEAIQQAEPRAGAASGGLHAADPQAWETILAAPADQALLQQLDRGGWARAALFFVVLRGARALSWLLFGFRVRGARHLPRDGAFLIAPNHQSFIDGFVVVSALPFSVVRRIFFVGAAEYYTNAATRFLARLANIIPVDPDANLLAAMQVSAAGLRSGHVLVLFPEGERTIDGDVKTFRKGAAILGSQLHVPIVPAALDGLYEIWPRSRPLNWGRLIPGRTPRVSLSFGPPMTATAGAEAEDSAALQQGVQQLFRELRAG